MSFDDRFLFDLAPARLNNLRQTRYGGGDMGVLLSELPPDDATHVRELYAALSTLLGGLRVALRIPAGDGGAPGGFSNGSPDIGDASVGEIEQAITILRSTAKSPQWSSAIHGARALHAHQQDDGRSESDVVRVRQAFHDVRGGALAALALTLEFIAIGGATTADVVRCFYLTRDHLKIMRNAIEDIDTGARARDQVQRDHGADLLFEKWSGATHRLAAGASARVAVDSTYDGPVSRRCLEFSALDRVLYNLMNNAVRFTTDGVVELYLRMVHGNLRFVVANATSAEHRAVLARNHGDAMGTLFLGGFSTGGEGVGLSICGEFVANAYGLASGEDAIAGGHVGAKIVDGAFVAWFHWPLGA